jgi:MFS family permease
MASRFAKFSRLRGEYPRQFWLMFVGMLLSTIGSSMVWPFLMIYVSTKLNLPLTQAASLMTINSAVGLASAFIAGPVIDRFGRKWMMVISLVGFGLIYLLYTQVTSFAFMALLMASTGLINPLYRVGADAMLADLIPPEKRPDAYALIRMSNNAGISIGPAIGGFLAAVSYNYAFLGAAVGMSTYGVLLAIFAKETLPSRVNTTPGETPARPRIRLVSPLPCAADLPNPMPASSRTGLSYRLSLPSP